MGGGLGRRRSGRRDRHPSTAGGSGWYAASSPGWTSTRARRSAVRAVWQTQGLALSPDGTRAAVVEGYASDHGLLDGSLMLVDLVDGTDERSWPELETVGIAAGCDDESLWYARTDGTGNACGRMWLDGRREERWRGDAFIGDEVTTPVCSITDDAAAVWTTHQAHGAAARAGAVRSATGSWSRLTSFNADIVEGHGVPRRTHDPVAAPEDGVEIEGVLMTPARRGRSAAR